jgi:hypothetical protein
MIITQGERGALEHLHARGDGRQDFVNIAQAQGLARHGLAEHTRDGWSITGAGRVWLDAQDDAADRLPPARGQVLPFARRAPDAPVQ